MKDEHKRIQTLFYKHNMLVKESYMGLERVS